ncbi:MAG: hypothetical protein WA979_13175 [Pacificimonas sp.]
MVSILLRSMMGAAATICGLGAASAAAATTVIEGWQHPPNADMEIGRPQIRATHDGKRYTGIRTRKVKSWIVLRGHAPNRANGNGRATIRVANVAKEIDAPISRGVYRVDFDYERPLSPNVIGQPLYPARMCNERLNAVSGAARTAFLREGTEFVIPRAYPVALESAWMVRPKPRVGPFNDPPARETWTNETHLDLLVICPPIDRNAGAVRTNPDDNRPTRTNPEAAPSRANPEG